MNLRYLPILTVLWLTANCEGGGSTSEEGSVDTTETPASTTAAEGTTSLSSTTSDLSECGNSVLEPDEECDKGEQNGSGRQCLANCAINIYGDGDTLVGIEQCDDGNLQSGDGCDAGCLLEGVCSGSIVLNQGFEDGVLAPWVTNGDADLSSENQVSGMWSAAIHGNFFIEQTIPATPSEKFTNATFWSWHDVTDKPLLLIVLTYEDESYEQRLYEKDLDGWKKFDILGDLDAEKSLVNIKVWGYKSVAPGPDLTLLDDFNFCAQG
jgi:cysteine-rich repeat protein